MKPFNRILINLWPGYSQWEIRQQVRMIMKEPLATPGDPEKFRPELDEECIRIWSSTRLIDIDAMIRHEKRKAG